MLPLCSPTNSKVSSCGGFKSFSSYWMTFDANHNSFDRVSRNISNMASFKRIPSSCIHFNVGNSIPRSICENGSLNLRQSALSSYHIGVIDEPHYVRSNGMMILENSTNSNSHDQLVNFVSSVIDNTEVLPSLADVESVTPFKSVSHPVYDAFSLDATSLSSVETTFSDIVSKMRESAADTFYRGQSYLNNVSGSVTSSLTATIKHTNQAVEISINEITSFINKSAGSVSCKLDGLSSEVKEASGRAGPFALDVLRGTVIVVENSLLQGGKTIGDAYSFVKEFLPSEVQEAVGLSEEKVGKVLIPAGTVLHQIYLVVEGFEESLGLDPNDPLVPFLLFLGFSVTL